MKFLIDTQLPPALKDFLSGEGYDAKHTYVDYPNGHLMTDSEIRLHAIEESRIVITKDKDFRDYFHLRGAPPKVLLLALGNISNLELKIYLQDNLKVLVDLLERDFDLVIAGKDQITLFG